MTPSHPPCALFGLITLTGRRVAETTPPPTRTLYDRPPLPGSGRPTHQSLTREGRPDSDGRQFRRINEILVCCHIRPHRALLKGPAIRILLVVIHLSKKLKSVRINPSISFSAPQRGEGNIGPTFRRSNCPSHNSSSYATILYDGFTPSRGSCAAQAHPPQSPTESGRRSVREQGVGR